MEGFNDKFGDCVLTNEDLASVSGGASGNEKRTIIVCPLCNVERTYETIGNAIPDFCAHYNHLKELRLADNRSIMSDYIKKVWETGTPVKE